MDFTLQKGKIIVFTGISGSGKSAVIFDTIARESERLMTLNYPQYIRNQMPRYEKPNADVMKNLSSVVVVEQKVVSKQTRSTVGTYWVIELGPTGGTHGGYILFESIPEEMLVASTPIAKWLRESVRNLNE